VPVPNVAFEKYYVSCDYGTVNPASFGLWGLHNGVFYRIKEYYYDSRKEQKQRTDEEHYYGLLELIGDLPVESITVDPSAASFIAVINSHKKYSVIPAKNNVIDGIRQVSSALSESKIKICNSCKDSMREFSVYCWNINSDKDEPIKQNDHAMDDIRYFVSTILNARREELFVGFASAR
jgi:PBSX family phage terminase large subunit